MNSGIPALCPCGSGLAFTQCCHPFISFQYYPDAPEQLMRSRYSAYYLKNQDYLLKSWHPSTRPGVLDLENDPARWKKLKIISASGDKVKFVAFYEQGGDENNEIFALYEDSVFIKEMAWLYHHGEDLKTFSLSRNRPCPCQSGMKFKRCCGQDL